MKKFGLPPYYQTEQAVEALKSVPSFSVKEVDIDQQKLRYVTSGNEDKPIILFIHGSPGAWTAWADYLADKALEEKYHMIAIDRPGFGGSDNGAHEPSVQKQAQIIMQALEQYLDQSQSFLVIGHSYGGPVALRLALDYPHRVRALGLLAPSISPTLEKVRWYNYFAAFAPVRLMLPKAVDRSNQEIIPLKAHLKAMMLKLNQLKVPVFIVQGKQDKLVPYQNAAYAKEHFKNAPVEAHLIEERGHFIPWQEFDLVKEMIFKYAD